MISDYVKTDDAVNVKASPFHMTCFYNGICTFLKQYMAEKASDSYGVCRVKSVSRKRFCTLIASVFFSFATFLKKYLHFKAKDDIITDDINQTPMRGGKKLANIKSAKKRVEVAKKKTLQNKMLKSQLKTDIKKFNAVAESGDAAATQEAMRNTVSAIDHAVAKGIIHKNTAANKKSSIMKRANEAK